jgi:hypothetical protein
VKINPLLILKTVPSLLEAVTYWQTLRDQGSKLADRTTFDTTNVRHFNLPIQLIDDSQHVPGSCVHISGRPGLVGSNAGSDDNARVALG